MAFRQTQHRQTIQELFERDHHTLWSAKSIKEALPDMDLVTIYRTLELFADEGLIREVRVSNQETLFEYAHDRHHHMICKSCETVQHIHLSPESIKNIPELAHLDPASIEITVRGECK